MNGPPPDAGAEPHGPGHQPLSEAERATALRTGQPPVDRAAALRAGRTPVPRKAIVWIVVGFVVLGLGGALGEHLLGNTPGVGSPTSTPVAAAPPASAPPTPVAVAAPPIGAPLHAFLGLKTLAGGPAPAVDLVDQTGAPWTLARARGKVVVLAFFSSDCSDSCPVIGAELVQADRALGARSSGVEFVVVNTDPLKTTITPDPPALVQTGLSNLPNVTYLNGTLTQLAGVWTRYGVTVTVQKSSGVVTHNDIMYLVDPAGRLRLRVSPFANEDQLGVYSLPVPEIERFGAGVAASAASLSGSS